MSVPDRIKPGRRQLFTISPFAFNECGGGGETGSHEGTPFAGDTGRAPRRRRRRGWTGDARHVARACPDGGARSGVPADGLLGVNGRVSSFYRTAPLGGGFGGDVPFTHRWSPY